MTAAQRAAWRRAERQAARYRPEMQRAILTTWERVSAGISLAQLERLISAGAIDAIANLVSEATGAILGLKYTPLIRETFRSSAVSQMTRLPSPLAGARFDLLNPNTVRAALGLETTALNTLSAEVAETVRQVVARGITEGVNPRTVARTLRQAVGLAPNQEAAVANYRAMLEGGSRSSVLKSALDSPLRDRRFDSVLAKARATGERLTEAQVDRAATAYANRFTAWNAETHARTAALDAQRLGQKEAWETSLRDTGFDRERVTKQWVATDDDRTRDEHREADGTIVQIDEIYPFDGGVMTPGEGTYNCRCVEIIRITIGPDA